MSDWKSALRAREKARAARDNAREATIKRIAWRKAREAETGSVDVLDATMAALQRAEETARQELQQAELALSAHAGPHVASLAPDRARIAKAALAAIAALEKAEMADRELQREHAWARVPGIIGELPFIFTAMRQRLEQTLRELEPTPSRRVA